jgi:soluble lytic murein transglycosylase-like protein
MSSIRYNLPNSEEETAALSRGGCLSGFILPPLAVMFMGAVLTFILLSASPSTTPIVMAAGDPQANVDAQAAVGNSSLATPASPSSAVGGISPVFQPPVEYWASKIQVWAAQAGLDPNLVATVMQIESCGDPQARSSAGAMGLFQVMPYHFATGDNPYDPDTNAARGLDYLKRSLAAANGNIRLALAGYNGGIGVINKAEYDWSSQTQNYASIGSQIYAEAASGRSTSPLLQQRYSSGGYLCNLAAKRLGISQ